MNWTAAHKINNNAFIIGAGWEAKIIQMFKVLSKHKTLKSVDIAILLAFIQKELDKIAQAEIEALENVLFLAYRYSLNATLEELEDEIHFTVPSLALGYDTKWCQDGKDYIQRVMDNIGGIKLEIEKILLSNPEIQIDLILQSLKKAENEWKRLIRTEIEAAHAQGCRDANLIKGALYAVIENDSPCDEICAEMVGEHEVSLHGILGRDLPPYHPFCRCVFLGVFSK